MKGKGSPHHGKKDDKKQVSNASSSSAASAASSYFTSKATSIPKTVLPEEDLSGSISIY